MNDELIFEQPLNERIRNLLRLEHLFAQAGYRMARHSEWDCRNRLECLLKINDLLSRADLKAELIKELERHAAILGRLADNPEVDQARLPRIEAELGALLSRLKDSGYQPGAALRRDELVTGFRQRLDMAVGACNFDLPRFHYWLNRPVETRRRDLENWRRDLTPLNRATGMALDMIRNSTRPQKERASGGFYQSAIESGLSCQLIRVILPSASHCYPEISAGRHRFTIRFMEETGQGHGRPAQTGADVDFRLHCCIL